MAYRFKRGEKIEPGVHRIAAEQLDEILAELDDPSISVDERIHASRKGGKKVRGLLRLVRSTLGSTYRAENEALRDAARLLSPARDGQIIIAAFDALAKRDAAEDHSITTANSIVRDSLLQRRQELVGESSDLQDRLAEYRERIAAIRNRVGDWPVEKKGVRAVRQGFRRTYAAAQSAFASASENGAPDAFHQWRRRVKDHWCHLLLLENLWPPVLKSHSDRVNELAGLLGEANDMAVLLQTLKSNPKEFDDANTVEAIVALAMQRQERLQSKAKALGAELFQAKPKRLARPIAKLWKT
jgi:CHAD domain-containing protein